MQLRHLRYFIAVAEQGSFLQASRTLRVAQPSLSKLIQDLEREIGVALLERLPRGVQLTPAGEAFLVEARNAVEAAARAVASARRIENEAAGRLNLGHVPAGLFTRPLSDFLDRFGAANPDITVHLEQMSVAKLRAALREKSIDVGAAFVASLDIPDYATLPIVDCAISGVMISAASPLAQLEKLSLADLRDKPFLYLPRQLSMNAYPVIKAALAERGVVPRVSRPRSLDILSTGMQIVAEDGWLLANEAAGLAYQQANSSVTFRPFIEPRVPLWFSLLWHRTDSRLVNRLVSYATWVDPVPAADALQERIA